ncbi:Y-family DNA polymerase [Colwellia sp. MEBiC06753]
MLWLYLYFPQLQLDSLFIQEAEQQALIIVDAKANQVVQLNQAAQNVGIRLGMGLATACAMCRHVQVLPYDVSVENKQLKGVAENLYQWVADIAFDQPDGLYLGIGNMLALYKSLSLCWQALTDNLAVAGVSYYYATAEQPAMARAIARARKNLLSDDVSIIKQVFSQLPVELVFTPSKFHCALQRLGIKTLAQLIKLDSKALAKRFDSEFLLLFGQLTGRYVLPLTFYQPTPAFTDSLELLYEVKQVSTLKPPLMRMVNKLEHYLRVRNLASQQLLLTFPYREEQGVTLTVNSAEPSDSASHWLQLIELKLESVQLKQPVVAINLSCSVLVAKQYQVNQLFEQGKNAIAPTVLISLLQAKLGDANVWQLGCADSHLPEQAQALKAANDNGELNKVQDSAQSLIRPSYLLPAPIKVDEPVSIMFGPERIESHWWQQSVIRDYFIGRTTSGRWCWLYRQPDQTWFVHGYFG